MSVDVPNVTLFANQDPYFIPVAQAQPNLGALVRLTGVISQLGLDGVVISPSQIILTIGVVAGTVSTDPTKYTVIGPSTVTITGVSWTPGTTYATLTYTGSFVAGTYAMSVVQSSILDNLGNFNTADPFPLLNTSGGALPVVANYVPAPGTGLLPTQTISFDVTVTGGGFKQLLLEIEFPPLGIREIAWDSDSGFGPNYQSPGNSATAITNGFHFVLLRNNAWPASPTLVPRAISGGQENP